MSYLLFNHYLQDSFCHFFWSWMCDKWDIKLSDHFAECSVCSQSACCSAQCVPVCWCGRQLAPAPGLPQCWLLGAEASTDHWPGICSVSWEWCLVAAWEKLRKSFKPPGPPSLQTSGQCRELDTLRTELQVSSSRMSKDIVHFVNHSARTSFSV